MIKIFSLFTLQNNNNKSHIQRSLTSIVQQTHTPDHLVVINDSCQQQPLDMSPLISCIPAHISLTFLKNTRTTGLSGAWNTGLSYIVDNYCIDPNNTYITIMSDQYKWAENHIKSCVQYSLENKDIVLSGIIRCDNYGKKQCKIYDKFNIHDVLNGQLNIHFSTIFVRFSSLLEAGLFDELMHTLIIDDLCIRLLEINASTIATNCHTVYYFPDLERNTLSAKEKLSVQKYFQKYHCRMTVSQKQAFQQYNFITEKKIFSIPVNSIKTENPISFQLVVGVICGNSEQLSYLLKDLCFVQSLPFIESLKVLILKNGGNEQSLKNLTVQMNNSGLCCYLITQFQQEKDAENGCFGTPFKRSAETLSIGKARTILQRYLFEFVKNDMNSIVWILDDDMRLDERVEMYLPVLPEFKKQGVDILLGTFEGASPNPATSGMRVQLVDLINNIQWLNSMNENDSLMDRSHENWKLRKDFPDYYYDLSRMHTSHLETVYWLTPNFQDETVHQSKKYLLNSLHTLFAGSSLLRPVIVELPADPLQAAEDSVNRGGNTFILNPMALINSPNSMITVSGKDARRSDMLWALINRYYYGMNIKRVNFPVIHNRCVFDETQLSIQKTIGEIQGASLHAALKNFFKQCDNERATFDFDNDMIITVCKTVNDYLDKRLSSFKLNFYRIQGLCKALSKIDTKNEMERFLNKLSSFYVNNTLSSITSGVKELSSDHVKKFLYSLKMQVDSYAVSELNSQFYDK